MDNEKKKLPTTAAIKFGKRDDVAELYTKLRDEFKELNPDALDVDFLSSMLEAFQASRGIVKADALAPDRVDDNARWAQAMETMNEIYLSVLGSRKDLRERLEKEFKSKLDAVFEKLTQLEQENAELAKQLKAAPTELDRQPNLRAQIEDLRTQLDDRQLIIDQVTSERDDAREAERRAMEKAEACAKEAEESRDAAHELERTNDRLAAEKARAERAEALVNSFMERMPMTAKEGV